MLTDTEIELLQELLADMKRPGSHAANTIRGILDREKKRKQTDLLRDRIERAEAIG